MTWHPDVVLYHGDCLKVLLKFASNSVDTTITDSPYGLKFMGKGWDHGVPGMRFWKEILRVNKPGATLLAFGGTRTHHRLMCAIEDAGWEIRDCMMWLYGSGFPKSHDVSKAIDRAAGAEREVIGIRPEWASRANKIRRGVSWADNTIEDGSFSHPEQIGQITAPATEPAKLWDGWGTALKPAWEPIIVAMKPIEGTFANNALEWGVAGLWVDGARIGTAEDLNPNDYDDTRRTAPKFSGRYNGGEIGQYRASPGAVPNGRWPANLILSHHAECRQIGMRKVKSDGGLTTRQRVEGQIYQSDAPKEMFNYADADGYETVTAWECHPNCPVRLLDEQSGESVSRPVRPESIGVSGNGKNKGLFGMGSIVQTGYYDISSKVSRFFYCAKASRSERNDGCDDFYWHRENGHYRRIGKDAWEQLPEKQRAQGNIHSTVKPLSLMEYLCKLTRTPTGGIVLDPFMGSGSTLVACVNTGRGGIGIELEQEYFDIAQTRVDKALSMPKQMELTL